MRRTPVMLAEASDRGERATTKILHIHTLVDRRPQLDPCTNEGLLVCCVTVTTMAILMDILRVEMGAIPGEDLRGAIVVLDIDGTITAHDGEYVEDAVQQVVTHLLTSGNHVYLVSNNTNTTRGRAVARATGATYVETRYRKPDTRVVDTIVRTIGQRVVVIGDKFLTDGLLAHRLGCTFYWVGRIRSRTDPVSVRIQYALDDLLRTLVVYI